MKRVFFVTGNKDKFKEAKKEIPILEQKDLDPTEIQSDSLEKIARHSAKEAHQQLKEPCFVEDSGIFINALNGFPGPYSNYIQRKIGNKGILRLLEDQKNREAKFKACIAFHNGEKVHFFTGETRGKISKQEKGGSGFGFDPIFIHNTSNKTFAQDPEHKQKVSHRKKAVEKLKNHLESHKTFL